MIFWEVSYTYKCTWAYCNLRVVIGEPQTIPLSPFLSLDSVWGTVTSTVNTFQRSPQNGDFTGSIKASRKLLTKDAGKTLFLLKFFFLNFRWYSLCAFWSLVFETRFLPTETFSVRMLTSWLKQYNLHLQALWRSIYWIRWWMRKAYWAVVKMRHQSFWVAKWTAWGS